MAASLMTGPGIPLETVTIFSVLGIQFWDFALGQPVRDGLRVAAQLKDADYAPLPASRTGSGVYAFQGLPGLHEVEYPMARAATSSPPPTVDFVITVADTLGRFLLMLFGVSLPLPYRGLFLSNDLASPPGHQPCACLFSAPTRAIAPGFAALRADLWDVEAKPGGQPAAHAALRVTVDGRTWTGIADERGRAVVVFPYPLVKRLTLGSPPGAGQGAITATTWPVSVQVLYQPEQLRFPLGAAGDAPWPWNVTPSLKSILDGQQAALIWASEAGPPAADWTGELTYGEELILRTVPNDPSVRFASLWISRGISSP